MEPNTGLIFKGRRKMGIEINASVALCPFANKSSTAT